MILLFLSVNGVLVNYNNFTLYWYLICSLSNNSICLFTLRDEGTISVHARYDYQYLFK